MTDDRDFEKKVLYLDRYRATAASTEKALLVVNQNLSYAEAEALVLAFRAAYPELYKSMMAATQEMRKLSDVLVDLNIQCEVLTHKLPVKNKRLRVSSKTGATWPKPKGGY